MKNRSRALEIAYQMHHAAAEAGEFHVEAGISQECSGYVEVDGAMRQAFDSEGRLLHPTMTGVKEFWHWFGDSCAVDQLGRPLVFYHGTKDQFSRFDKTKTVDGGFHFGSIAQASMRAAGPGKIMMEAYLRINNAQRSKDSGGKWSAKIKSAKASGKDAIIYLNRYEGVFIETIERAELEGFDLDRASDAAVRRFASELSDSVIVFEPSQIRLAETLAIKAEEALKAAIDKMANQESKARYQRRGGPNG